MPCLVDSAQKPVQGQSLYHTCVSVLDRLALVDGFQAFLDPSSQQQQSSTDPFTKLWALCRLGTPLCTLFNALDPKEPLSLEYNHSLNEANNAKAIVYHFLVSCRKELDFAEEDLFGITDIFLDDTNGFVKVVNTIAKILQILQDRGVISAKSPNRNSDPNAPKDTRDKIVLELLETERKYVQDMELLQNYMRELQTQKIISADTVHYLFGNLNALVDFQRRFLIQLEDIAEKPAKDQQLGLLFVQMEEAFTVYEPYCSNYYSAQDLVKEKASELLKLEHALSPAHQLLSMLIKPVQRICKYPLLMASLVKSTNSSWASYPQLIDGSEAIKRVAEKVNETQRKQENLQLVLDLKRRMDDWEGPPIDSHGSLLLQEKLMVTVNDLDREYLILLFEKAILICKELKEGTKNRLAKTNTIMKKKRRASIQAMRTISVNRITQIINKSAGGWELAVEWNQKSVQQVTLKFRNEEQLKQWETVIEKARMNIQSTVIHSTPLLPTPSQSTSDKTSFTDSFDDDDDEDEYGDEEVGKLTRSRSSSFSAQILNSLGRQKMVRDNSTDTKTRTFHTIPGMNLMPLPRGPLNGNQHPSFGDPNVVLYPVSPPPSNPSSPTTPTGANTSSIGRTRQATAEDSQLDIITKLMFGSDGMSSNYSPQFALPPPINRSQSHSTALPSSHPPTLPLHSQHTRLRSQSSPNIHKAALNSSSSADAHWDEISCLPGFGRTGLPSPSQSTKTEKRTLRTMISSSRLSDLANPSKVPQSPTQDTLKVKLTYNEGVYCIVTPQHISFADLMERVEKKIKIVGNLKPNAVLRLKYSDEDEDHITISSDDDVQMAFESRGQNAVNLFVSL
ncbi:hypothetical protein CLU79DRAFT_711363 [Phycomyces nitens]|nr:hypothetical protein CLU79DRAFT_711363 [Phycomyces nitens]